MKLNEIAGGGKVWILFHDEPYEGASLFGVFSSKAEAAKSGKVHGKKYDNPTSYYAVREVNVNQLYGFEDLLRDDNQKGR